MFIRHKSLFATAALIAATAITGAAFAQSAAPPSAAESGAWQPHKYTFNFFGFTSTYSCGGLEDKLKLLLRMTGAGEDVQVVAPCVRGYGKPDKLALAYLTFSSLQPATTVAPEGVPGGEWRHVSVSPRHPFDIGDGDCELVEQFRDKVLPLFTVRNLKSNVTCVPHQQDTNFSLSFDVFAPPVPPKKA